MSKIALEGNPLGSGTFTIASPNSSSSFTLTLPTASGTVVTTAGAQTIEFAAGTAGAPSITFTGDTNTGIFSPAADTIAFSEGGAEAMRIDSSGNVGIANTSPIAQANGVALTIGTGSVNTQPFLKLARDRTGGFFAGIQIYNSSSISSFMQEDGDGNLRFGTANTERMRITSSGNVGIGTSSPTTKLTVSGGAVRAGGFSVDDRGTGATVSYPDWRLFNNASNQFEINNFSSTAILCGSSSEVYFPATGTTASAANAHLVSGESNKLLRSTSSIRYKTDVETLDPAKSKAILNFRPVWYRSLAEADRKDWSWYGLIAEEVAEIEPRLVHWSYPESEYEEVETEVEQERTVTDEDGNETTETYTETKTERKLKEDAQLAPDGVQYDRLTVMLLDIVKRQDESIKALEARIAALETGE